MASKATAMAAVALIWAFVRPTAGAPLPTLAIESSPKGDHPTSYTVVWNVTSSLAVYNRFYKIIITVTGNDQFYYREPNLNTSQRTWTIPGLAPGRTYSGEILGNAGDGAPDFFEKFQFSTLDACNEPSTNNCSSNAACALTEDLFNCTCDEGYTGDGATCRGFLCDEGFNNCSSDARCEQFGSAFNCTCLDGFAGDGFTCTPYLCDDGRNNCSSNARCQQFDSDFNCTCLDGFTGDGISCTSTVCQNNPSDINRSSQFPSSSGHANPGVSVIRHVYAVISLVLTFDMVL